MPNKNSVLIIEDDEDILASLSDLLEASGFDVICCGDGLQALECAREGRFTAVITDFGLPGLNGAEIVRFLRAQCPPSFIIGVSAEDKKKAFLDAGVDAYLQKPYSFQELLSLVQKQEKT